MQQTAELPVDPRAVMAIAREAGRLVVEMQQRGLDLRTKSSDIDLVTEADVAAEELLADGLRRLDASIGFWGEESNEPPDEEYFWLVDPIDGTVNYALGLPLYSVNIALNQRDETLFGCTLSLPNGVLFWAQKGAGAFRLYPDGREERLRVSDTPTLNEALLSTGFPYHRASHADNNLAEFARLITKCRGVRRLGSAAIDFAYVAAGIFTAHWEAWIKPWDTATGTRLVHEAGGLVTTYGGHPRTYRNQSIIASNGQPDLHRALVENIQVARASLADRLFEE